MPHWFGIALKSGIREWHSNSLDPPPLRCTQRHCISRLSSGSFLFSLGRCLHAPCVSGYSMHWEKQIVYYSRSKVIINKIVHLKIVCWSRVSSVDLIPFDSIQIRLDYIRYLSWSSAIHETFWLLSPRKVSSQSTALPSFFPMCSVVVFAYHRLWGLLFFWQMDMRSLPCSQIWVRAVHTKGGQAQTSLHKSWLGRTVKRSLTLPRQEIEPRVFG